MSRIFSELAEACSPGYCTVTTSISSLPHTLLYSCHLCSQCLTHSLHSASLPALVMDAQQLEEELGEEEEEEMRNMSRHTFDGLHGPY